MNLNCRSLDVFGLKFGYIILALPILNIHHKNSLKLYCFFFKSFGEKRSVKSVRILSAKIKWINPVQKYLHIIGSYAWILKIFVFMFFIYEELSINCLISFGICSTSKESKLAISILFTCRATQGVPIS